MGFTEYINDFGIGDDNSFYVQTNTGKVKITIENFLKYISYLNPQFIVCPFEYLPPDCGKKRVVRCYKKIKIFFENIKNDHKNNFSKLNFIIPYFLEHIEFINKNEIDFITLNKKGVLIFTEDYSDISYEKILKYKEKLNNINVEMKIKSSSNNILDILIGHEIGCEYFEVNFPFIYAEKSQSLNIEFNTFDKEKNYGNVNDINNFNYKINLLNLNDANLYENNMDILTHNCDCFVCKTGYNKSYIHHLIKCKELNGTILLSIHNIYQAKKLHENYISFENDIDRLNYLMWFLTTQCRK